METGEGLMTGFVCVSLTAYICHLHALILCTVLLNTPTLHSGMYKMPWVHVLLQNLLTSAVLGSDHIYALAYVFQNFLGKSHTGYCGLVFLPRLEE
jgi:hypothetical protein